jgi:hypothetical protein
MGLPPLSVAPMLTLTVLGEVPAVAVTPVGTPGTVAASAFEPEPSESVEQPATTARPKMRAAQIEFRIWIFPSLRF